MAVIRLPNFAISLALGTLGSLAYLQTASGEVLPSEQEIRGRAALDAAVAALGGLNRIASIGTWYVQGRGRENLSAELQGLAPDRPTWRPHQERLAVDAMNLSIAWERRTPRNDGSLRWRRLIYKSDGSGFIDWNSQEAASRSQGAPEARRLALSRRVPHLLLADVANRATRVAWQGAQPWRGRSHDLIAVDLPEAGELLLWLGKTTHLLHRAEYKTNLPGRGDVSVDWEWPRWKAHSQLGFAPEGHRIHLNGTLFQEVRYSHYQGPSALVPTLIEIPHDLLTATQTRRVAGGRGPPDEHPLPATGEIAPGVHIAALSGFVVMFVEFRDFVVAMEAPEIHPGLEAIPAALASVQLTPDFLALISKTIPGKPLRYLILSHHHSDHLGGVRRFAAAGATVLTASSHREAVRAALDAPHTLVPDPWPGSSRDTKIEVIGRRRAIGDGVRTLEVINIGPNPHTDENLFAWLPVERVLFQGDLFYYAQGEPFPPSGRGRINGFFARWLKAHRIEPIAIYGVHNFGAAGPKSLSESIARSN